MYRNLGLSVSSIVEDESFEGARIVDLVDQNFCSICVDILRSEGIIFREESEETEMRQKEVSRVKRTLKDLDDLLDK